MNVHFEEPVSNISERLKQALEVRHMSAADLSRATGITTASISHYLAGRYTPKQDKIYLLSKALRVNPAWLMGFNVRMDSQKPYSVTDAGLARARPTKNTTSTQELSPELSKELTENARALYSPFSDNVRELRHIRSIAEQITRELDSFEKKLPSKEDQQLLDRYSQLTPANQQIINSMLDTMLQTQNGDTK